MYPCNIQRLLIKSDNIFKGQKKNFSTKIKKKARRPMLTNYTQTVLEIPATEIRGSKTSKPEQK